MMTRLIPDTLAAQMFLVLTIGLMLSHALSVALYFNDRTSALLTTGGEHTAERIVSISEIINRAPQIDRQQMVASADQSKLHVTWSPESVIDTESDDSRQVTIFRDALVKHFEKTKDPMFRIAIVDRVEGGSWQDHFQKAHQGKKPGATLMVSLQAKDGSWLNFAAPTGPIESFWTLRFVLSLLVMLLAVMVFAAFAVRKLTKPIITFASAARELGFNLNAPSLPEVGASEIRNTAHAFNKMQDRIKRLIEDRTRMVAAISHDLGTPITRLRLRAEFVENEEQQKKMLSDLDDMEVMVNSVMSFARNEASREPRAAVDIRTLLRRICDDKVDAGDSVKLDADGEAVRYVCQPVAMRRALTNLINNAVNYGHEARVSLQALESGIEIQIDDDGPGIPEESQADVFKPFHRLERSRNRETGGVGLGLSVARTIIRGHGGEIWLKNRSEGGLRVTVSLPLQ